MSSNESSANAKNDDKVEQITKLPSTLASVKVKDPKKVAAGKKLAESNKRAREALAREEKRDAESKVETETSGDGGDSWLPERSFSNVLTVVGLGLTVFQLFQTRKEKSTQFQAVRTELQSSSKHEPAQPLTAQPARPRMGMD